MIPFNKPFISSNEINNIIDTIEKGKISGDGYYTKLCHEWFAKAYDTTALLTHSCTAALEMAAILLDLKQGDEVIMPSYTFVSTANAFVLRGAVPVFVDIRPDTLNIDETKIEAAITEKTKAIVPVHYAGVACEMDAIMAIAKKHNLYVVEDAAQGFDATYKGKLLGTIGHLGTLSFHETKNIISGEGGALLINDPRFVERAEIIREKGTNRSRFFRGQVDKYTWVDIGSSFLPSDIIAAFLYAQFETHMYYVLFDSLEERTAFITYLKAHDVMSVFHYIPLHSSPAGLGYCKTPFEMPVTDDISETLVRLPLFYGLNDAQVSHIFDTIRVFLTL